MQHNGPVNIVFTGLYVWVVPVTSGNYTVLIILVLVIATGCIYLQDNLNYRGFAPEVCILSITKRKTILYV